MPKQYQSESVLHDWVQLLPFQMQALLLTDVRGPDGSSKYNAAKAIVRYFRGITCKPAGNWHGKNDNDFMWGDYTQFTHYTSAFFEDHDEYPHHFIMHLTHCSEVVGYKHPNPEIRGYWIDFYNAVCESFHMNPETEEQMDARLNDFGEGWHNEPQNKKS